MFDSDSDRRPRKRGYAEKFAEYAGRGYPRILDCGLSGSADDDLRLGRQGLSGGRIS